jgi:Fe-coproporphyrin III synthase
MKLTNIARKAAVYGQRHVRQELDYRLGRGWSRPDRITIRLTMRCNAKCLMCDFWQCKTREQDEISTDRWIEVIEELHDWIGPFFLYLVGGEVFLKRDFFKLLKRVVELDLSPSIITNGIALKKDNYLDPLIESGLKALYFSIDGMDPEIHDKYRGINGAFEAATSSIQEIKRRRPEMLITANCIMMRETMGQLLDYVAWAEKIGIDRIIFQPICPTFGFEAAPPNWHKLDDRFPNNPAETERILTRLGELSESTDLISNNAYEFEKFIEYFNDPSLVQITRNRCTIGQTNMNIDEFGRIDMCYAFDTTIGNINDGPIKDTWCSTMAREKRNQIKKCERPCISACYRSPSLKEKVKTFYKYARSGRI